jgi:glucokinase-like ROK family protein
MKQLNRSAILDLLRQQGPLSRATLARRLHLSPATVSRIVGQLIEEDLVHEGEIEDSSTGRKPTLLRFNFRAHAVVGIDVGGTKMLGTVADLNGDILHRILIPSAPRGDTSGSLDLLFGLIDELVHHGPMPTEKIRGIAVGVPSIVAEKGEMVLWAPALRWRNLPLRSLLKGRFGIKTFVENDVNLAALGEHRYGAGRGVRNLVCIAIGTGIGGGLILNGDLYRGQNGAAGEVGYMIPERRYLGQIYDGFGCLETLASGRGVARRALQALQKDGANVALGPPYGQLSVVTPSDGLTAEHVFDAAREGDPLAQDIVAETIDYLGQAVANVISTLNPEMVILGGGMARSGDLLLEPIKEKVHGTIPMMPQVVLSELGDDAVVKGAIALAIQVTQDDIFVRETKTESA